MTSMHVFIKPSLLIPLTESSLPRPDDQLWIITDGAVRSPGLAATLYVSHANMLWLAGLFSAKLHRDQPIWLPCEIETLSITAAAKHFSLYIIQSKTSACNLTNSKPRVQAFEKLCCDEFSSSSRVATFLLTVSMYQATLCHVAGAAVLHPISPARMPLNATILLAKFAASSNL